MMPHCCFQETYPIFWIQQAFSKHNQFLFQNKYKMLIKYQLTLDYQGEEKKFSLKFFSLGGYTGRQHQIKDEHSMGRS